jgi:hypothetical protein
MSENYLKKLTKDKSKPPFSDFLTLRAPRKALSTLRASLEKMYSGNSSSPTNAQSGFDHALDPLRSFLNTEKSSTDSPSSSLPTSSKPKNNIVPFPNPNPSKVGTDNLPKSKVSSANQMQLLLDQQRKIQEQNSQKSTQNSQNLNREISARSSF